MIRILLFLFTLCCLSSCSEKSKVEKEIEQIPVEIKVERFDQLFFETTPQNLQTLKKKYPYFFPTSTPDEVWIEKMQNPQWRELYKEVQKKYSDFEPVQAELNTFFKRLKFYFPSTKTPKVVTVIAEMDYNNKVIYTDSLVVIALELYLGAQHKFYQFPKYIAKNFEQKQILPDLVSSFSKQKIAAATDQYLLGLMIEEGKKLYLKDVLLPAYSDADKIGYSPEQNTWCQENEGYMWRYFLENELLYSKDQKLPNRFMNLAPFSKFYLEIDNESPGRVGAWMGWQMVRSFMNNNDVALQTMLTMNAKELFEKSKYKPQKNGN